jgi:glycosyltransferase involved in cell wall biosynthesis
VVALSPTLYCAVARAKRGRNRNIVDLSCDLVVESFPRSGTTFLVAALGLVAPEVTVASHLHHPAHVRLGLRLGVPVVVLVRDPVAACTSLAIFRPGSHPAELLSQWIAFYTDVARVPGVTFVDFDALVADPTATVDAVLSLVSEGDRGAFAVDASSVMADVDRLTIARRGEVDPMRVSHPTPEREQVKAAVRDRVLEEEALVEQARALWRRLLPEDGGGSGAPRSWLVHDFGGYAFAADLSRSLAAGGDEVLHAWCGGVTSGKGALTRRSGDAAGLRFVDVQPEPFERYSPLARIAGELRYGVRLARLVRRERPDVVVSGNTPVLSQALLWVGARSAGSVRIHWLQDFLGRGVRGVLGARSRALGATAGRAFEAIEGLVLRSAEGVVAITDDFVGPLREIGVRSPVLVMENWAPVDEITPVPRPTDLALSLGLVDEDVALYAGTLGLKHDPGHLVALARRLQGTGGRLVVATEGIGRDVLEQARTDEGLDSLLLLDLVPYEQLGALLGTADVGLVLLEPEAGTFSVPSKVLTYLAAGLPVVAAMPGENLAARTITSAAAGIVVEPGDHAAFVDAALVLLGDPGRRGAAGSAGRQYAERSFDVEAKRDRLVGFVASLVLPTPSTPPTASRSVES